MKALAEYDKAAGLLWDVSVILHNYLVLMKPRVVLLVVLTALPVMILEGSLLSAPLRFVCVLAGITLAAGAAGALNQYCDRDIDAVMARTREKRPIPTGKIEPRNALWFAFVVGVMGLVLLALAGNILATGLALGSIVWYILIYTKWLKRKTPLSIVVGGAAGAVGPLIGWAAGAGALSLEAWLMFLIVFLWTPIHFFALALYCKEEYAAAGIPMLPVTSGERVTYLHITFYAGLLVPATVSLGFLADLSWVFFVVMALLGVNLVREVILLWHNETPAAAQSLFSYSNLYLAVLFTLILMCRW